MYLKKHPDFYAFRIYQDAVDFHNSYLKFFSQDAFDNRRKYITEFYLAGREGTDREYQYLTETVMERFSENCAEEIYRKLLCESFL